MKVARTVPTGGMEKRAERHRAPSLPTYGARIWILNHLGGLGQRSGVPDLLICLDGRFLALEIKSPLGTGRLGPRQQEELEAIRQAGGVAAVISSWEELEKALSELEGAKR